jgi:hypothetical protein
LLGALQGGEQPVELLGAAHKPRTCEAGGHARKYEAGRLGGKPIRLTTSKREHGRLALVGEVFQQRSRLVPAGGWQVGLRRSALLR